MVLMLHTFIIVIKEQISLTFRFLMGAHILLPFGHRVPAPAHASVNERRKRKETLHSATSLVCVTKLSMVRCDALCSVITLQMNDQQCGNNCWFVLVVTSKASLKINKNYVIVAASFRGLLRNAVFSFNRK